MTVNDLIQKLNLTVYSGAEGLEKEVTGAYVSDLLSDVMGFAQEGQAWLTLQTHKNVMAIASLKDLPCIILVHGHKPDEDAIAVSEEENIPILGSSDQTFELSGKLYVLFQQEK